jgi:signal transduction histidine kinase
MPTEPRTFARLRRNRILADALLALVLCAAGIPSAFAYGHTHGARPANALAVVLVIGMTAPLALRRRFPVPVLAAVAAVTAIYDVANFVGQPGNLALFVAVYSVAAHTPRPLQQRTGIAFALALTWFLALKAVVEHHLSAGGFVGPYLGYGIAYLVGDNIRRRRERVADLEERARRAAHERALEARDAVARERAAIARELHDVVAHSMSVMVVHAYAARRLVRTDATRAEASIRIIEDTGRSSLNEMRRILGVLRNGAEAPELVPQPGIAELERLVGNDPAMPVELVCTGEPRELPAIVDVSAYRIVQEALTNVRKHAGPARVTVTLEHRPDSLGIRVDDDGRGAGAVQPNEPGHGLLGMQERAALCGGMLTAGPRAGGGWTVRAWLPHESEGA